MAEYRENHNPYLIVDMFEKRLAEWCGSKYCVCVESGTAAIFLSLQYRRKQKIFGIIEIPAYTYPSIPCSIIHAGFRVQFNHNKWAGEYELGWVDIWDAALRFRKAMYNGGFQCLSFHIKKHLRIGRGGAILTDDKDAYGWLKKARFDGRNPVPLQEDSFDMLGWNMYMTVEQAARGIELFETMRRKYPNGMEDLKVEDQGYPDLSKFSIYQQ